eukprot:6171923-Pleurochrysis_carterae.AAC.1
MDELNADLEGLDPEVDCYLITVKGFHYSPLRSLSLPVDCPPPLRLSARAHTYDAHTRIDARTNSREKRASKQRQRHRANRQVSLPGIDAKHTKHAGFKAQISIRPETGCEEACALAIVLRRTRRRLRARSGCGRT